MLFGRRPEQEAVEALLTGARAGRAGVLALVGEAGIGKSALLSYAASSASGMQRLAARGVQSEAHVPFAGLYELLRPALGALERIPPRQADALAGAFALRPARGEDRLGIGAATLSLLAARAEDGPLLVLVDDAHWLDGSSAAALSFAARRLAADAVAVLLAVRAGAPSLLDGTDLPRAELQGLSLDASTHLLGARWHTAAADPRLRRVATRLHRETGGNPLALLELVVEPSLDQETPVHEPLPVVATVGQVFADRARARPEAARRAALLLAASGTDDLAFLARATAALGGRIDDLTPAESAGLVAVYRTRAEWRHPLARSAVYGAASASERRAAHRALADALPDAEADRRAWHLALAAVGADAAAASALAQAGTRARDRSAYEEASLAFERAAQLTADGASVPEFLYMAADAAWLAGSGERAERLLDDASVHAPQAALAVRVEHLRGHIATRRGHALEGLAILRAGAELAGSVHAPTAVVMLAEAVNAAFYAADPDAMRSAAEGIPEVARRCSDMRSAFFAAISEGMVAVFAGEGERGPALIERAVSLLESSDELRDDPRLLAWAAMGPLWLRGTDERSGLVGRALEVARERSAAGVLPFLLCHVATFCVSTDRWAEAEATFHETIDLAAEMGQEAERVTALARLALLEARKGRFTQSGVHASEALDSSRALGLGVGEVWALSALGELELARGEPKEALGHYEELRGALRRRRIHDPDLWPEAELVEVHLRLGDVARAAGAAHRFTEAASAKGLPWALARAARARGLVADDGSFEAAFDEALTLHGLTPDVFEAARTRLAYGTRLRKARRRVRAREQLRLALDTFDRLGAEPWGDTARAELAATGEHVAPRHAPGLARLTPQELQIAILLARRRTTKEAAAALFVSPKTVEYHLRSVYRKLGVSSRDELAGAMRDAV